MISSLPLFSQVFPPVIKLSYLQGFWGFNFVSNSVVYPVENSFFSENFIKILLSVFIGGALGVEREFRSKSAGFRTLILICLAATLFTILSIQLGGKNNPDRIASNILTGIGFLGAGVIFKDENKVMGLTTAITIWVVSSLGMCIGLGMYLLAFQGAGFALLVLYGFSRIQRWIDQFSQVRIYMIRTGEDFPSEEELKNLCRKWELKTIGIKHLKNKNERIFWWTLKGHEKNQEKWVNHIMKDPGIIEFNY